jgi:UBX domain-containing protein 1/4
VIWLLIIGLQVKPLTEEEKEEKLIELKNKLAEKRIQKATQDAKEAQANEAIRRKSGKVRLVYISYSCA